MLTIATKRQVINIDIDLLKTKVKRTVIKLLKALSIISGFIGLMCIIVVANKDITLYQTFKYLAYSILFCGVTYILNFIKNALQKRI